MKTKRQILIQYRKLLEAMIEIKGESEMVHFLLNGAAVSLVWVIDKNVQSPFKQISVEFPKKTRKGKTSNEKKNHKERKNPPAEKRN